MRRAYSAIVLLRTRPSMDDTATDSQVMFSRSTGLPAALGKATEDLKCKVPGQVKEDFAAEARKLGLTESEFLRDMVLVRLYGHEQVARMHADRLKFAAGIGPQSVTTEGA